MADNTYLYYCRKCSLPVATKMEWDETTAHPHFEPTLRKLPDKKDGIEVLGRLLQCGHFVLVSDRPIAIHGPSEFLQGKDVLLSIEELKEIRDAIMRSILEMSAEELCTHIQEHEKDYQNHLKASKKEKYAIQLIEGELEQRKRNGKLSEKDEIQYAYLFTKSPRGAEKLAREKVRVENTEAKKVKAEDSALKQMLEVMKGRGKNITLEELKAKLGK